MHHRPPKRLHPRDHDHPVGLRGEGQGIADPEERRRVDDDGVVHVPQLSQDLSQAVGGGELAGIRRERPGDEHVEHAGLRDRRSGAAEERRDDGARLRRSEVQVDPLHRVFELDPTECDVGDPLDRGQPEEAVDVGPAQVEVDQGDPPTRASLGDRQVGRGRRLALALEPARDEDRPHVARAQANELEVGAQEPERLGCVVLRLHDHRELVALLHRLRRRRDPREQR